MTLAAVFWIFISIFLVDKSYSYPKQRFFAGSISIHSNLMTQLDVRAINFK